MKKDHSWEIDCAGLVGKMFISKGLSRCGHINNGIGLSLTNYYNNAPWVMSFEDLEKVYLHAKKLRDENQLTEEGR